MAGVAAAPAPQSSVTGYWYEEGQPDDPNVLTIMHLDPNGRFDVHFRFCHAGKESDDVESGVWVYANGVLDVLTLAANGQAIYHDDKYDTVSLDAKEFVYRYRTTGYVFSDSRIDPTSELPSCKFTS